MRIKDGVLISINKSKDIKKGNCIIPNSVTSIGDWAFYGCTSLTSVTIPNSVTSIGDYAFGDCYKLVEVINKSSLNITKGSSSYGYVGYYALNVKTSGESDIVNKNDYLFYTYNNVNYLIGYIGNATELTLPNDYNGQNYKIYNYAFYKCSSLTSITIPNSVTSIGKYAFYYCSSLTSITIPDSLTSIGSSAFYNCSSLTSITIGNSVTSIGDYAFYYCSSLKKEDKQYYYKAFNKDLTCRNFQYAKNKWFECDGEPVLCENGFHACKNAFDLFNYYYGELNKYIVIYKVELDGISKEKTEDSKVVAKRIRLVEKINSYSELLNEKEYKNAIRNK